MVSLMTTRSVVPTNRMRRATVASVLAGNRNKPMTVRPTPLQIELIKLVPATDKIRLVPTNLLVAMAVQ